LGELYGENYKVGVWLTPRFAIRSMANATLRYQEEEGRRKKEENFSTNN